MKLTSEQKKFVEDIMSKMTLEEKVGQLNQESPSIVGGFDVPFEELIEMLTDGRISQEEFGKIMATAEREYHEDDIRAGMVGAMMGNDPVKANELQKIAVEESRLGIPLLIGFDVIHGLRSVYPIAIAEAGTFDDELFERTAQMAAKESRAHGINWNYAPMLDVARDSRWGRVSEGPGEDTFLGSRFARAKIKGLQNNNENVTDYVAACTKHYVAYSACEAGRDYNTTTMSTSQLYNVYLPTFKAAMEEGACSAMASFNDLNGVPCTVNSYTLRDILKGEFGLEGFVVSDANGIRECVTHGIAEDNVDAGIQAMNAGLDMDMGTRIYHDHMVQAVKDGKVSMETLDDAVRRILSVKVWLGLFENPYVDEATIAAYKNAIPAEHVALCEEAAEKSIVLLKNEGNILPIKKDTKFTLVGELADRADEVVGAWALGWEREDCVSVKAGLEKAGAKFEYYPVCGPESELNQDELKEAIESDNDIVIAVVGEYNSMSGEASSKADITIPGKQREMLSKLKAAGKTVIAVLMNGRPLALGWEAENIPAIIEGWHLGITMGDALTKVIFGEVNPSGKLASTFSSVNGQEPLYYNHPNTGRPGSKSKFTSKYLDAPVEPCFPFGYGLSYTNFEYSDLKLEETAEEIKASFTLKNTGDVAGTEVAQLYMQDVTASLVRPVKELRNYARVALAAGESKQLTLSLRKCDMGFYNNQGKYVLEDGLFRIYVGGNSRDCMMEEVRIKF